MRQRTVWAIMLSLLFSSAAIAQGPGGGMGGYFNVDSSSIIVTRWDPDDVLYFEPNPYSYVAGDDAIEGRASLQVSLDTLSPHGYATEFKVTFTMYGRDIGQSAWTVEGTSVSPVKTLQNPSPMSMTVTSPAVGTSPIAVDYTKDVMWRLEIESRDYDPAIGTWGAWTPKTLLKSRTCVAGSTPIPPIL